jgi:hypothetical protein
MVLLPKYCHEALKNMGCVPGDQDLGSEIRDPKNLGSMIKPQLPFFFK